MSAAANDVNPDNKGVSWSARLVDTITNLLTGSGSVRDPSANMQVRPVVCTRHEAVYLYDGYWIARKIINIPVQDMMKNGRTFHDMDQKDVEAYQRAWSKLGIDKAIKTALIWKALFGGSAIVPVREKLILSDPHNPTNFQKATGVRFLVVDPYKMKPAEQEIIRDLTSPHFQLPRYFRYRGQAIDVSNLILVRGEEMPADDIARNSHGALDRFWGASELTPAKEPILFAHSLYQNIASMVHSNNIDILKVKGVYESLLACATNAGMAEANTAVQARAAMFAMFKGMHNVAIIDSEETVERLNYDFAGLPQLLHEFLTAISGLSEIPLTRFAGISPAGLNATGEADLDNHYNTISGKQESDLRPILDAIDAFVTLIVFGESRELLYTFNNPRTLSTKEQAELEKKKTESLATLSGLNIAPESVIARRMQRDHLPEISDDWIEELEKAEGADDDDDEPPETETEEDDPEETEA